MASRKPRYKDMERLMTLVLLAAATLFLVFLFASGFGTGWLKVTSAVLAILVSGLSLAYLFLTKELLRSRSLWMSAGFAAIVLCVVVSLICGYPSPNELKDAAEGFNSAAVGTILLP